MAPCQTIIKPKRLPSGFLRVHIKYKISKPEGMQPTNPLGGFLFELSFILQTSYSNYFLFYIPFKKEKKEGRKGSFVHTLC